MADICPLDPQVILIDGYRDRMKRRDWLTKTLVIITLVSLTQDAASELLYPLLPVFLTGVLAAPPVVLGVVEGVADATAGFTKFIAGRLSDRYGRKRFILAGYGLAAIGKVVVAAAIGWPMVLVGRVVDRFGKGLRSSPRDALIADSVPGEAISRAFGFHKAGDTMGAVIGPILGLLALRLVHGKVRAAMWCAVVPAALSVALVTLIKEPHSHRENKSDKHRRVSERDRTRLPKEFRGVTLLLTAISLTNFSDTLILLRVIQDGMSTYHVIAAYILFNFVYTVMSYPAGVLADYWPRGAIYACGLMAFGIAYIGLGITHQGGVTYLLVALYGVFPAFTDGVGKAWISSLVDAGHHGRAQGTFQSLSSGATLAAGLWAGLLWNVHSGHGAFPLVVAGIAGLLASVVMFGTAMAGWNQ